MPLKKRRKGKKAGADAGDFSSVAHEALQEKLCGSCQSLGTHLQV